VGRVRTNNEDCFRIVDSLNLYVLSDGMGGEAHGEIASALAVETVVKHCLEAEAIPQRRYSERPKPAGAMSRSVSRARFISRTRKFLNPRRRILNSRVWEQL
jgi:serine/threonine protein phosphatase PrpC